MADHRSHRELLYQYEVLRARLAIREYYLKTIVRDVYDNIGQVLSLVRVQLSLLQPGFEKDKKEEINSSGELVGMAIRDLRDICRRFHPDTDIISSSGFFLAIEREIKALHPDAVYQFNRENIIQENIRNGSGLILFGILLEIFILIKEQKNGRLISVEVKYIKNNLEFCIDYCGETIKRNQEKQAKDGPRLSIFERAEMLGGYLQIKKTKPGLRRIKLAIPIN